MRTKTWIRLTVDGGDDQGVDPRKLAKLLEGVAAAFTAIARQRLSAEDAAIRKVLEDVLAGVRILRVKPGSTTIEISPPPFIQPRGVPKIDR